MSKQIKHSRDFIKDYGDNVLKEGKQYQIDRHYEIKAIDGQRRLKVIMAALNISKGERVLEIGCGVGALSFYSAKQGAQVFGIDYSQESIAMAKDIVADYHLDLPLQFMVADASHIPLPDASFDKIICPDFIEHICDDEKVVVLKEIKRLLKFGGKAVIFTPNLNREMIGEIYQKIRHTFLNTPIPVNKLHFGLINAGSFNKMLLKEDFIFKLFYYDVTRPYLAGIPFLRNILALNLLWIIEKK
jgi:ubiquinone/menaquinone biosynthesis C-methylase UbiE